MMTSAEVTAAIAAVLGELPESIQGDDLMAMGLNSLHVMRLAGRWRAAGIAVEFSDLIERPSLAQWTELLAERTGQGGGIASVADAGGNEDDGAPFPLAPMQHAYWIGRNDTLVLGGVATHFYAEFDGRRIDADQLRSAVLALMRRHDMLRVAIGDDGTQRILPRPNWDGPTVTDLRDQSDAEISEALEAIRARLSHRRFAVGEGRVLDTSLTLLPDGTTRVHLNLDMMAADAISFRIIATDLARLYADLDTELPSIDYSFRRYLTDRQAARDQARERDRAYWEERIPSLPGGPDLPLAVAPEKLTDQSVTRRARRLDAAAVAALASAAAQRSLTLPMVFAAAYTQVIGAWSESQHFLLNVPMFDREPIHPDVEKLVGDFTTLLLLETDASAGSLTDAAHALQWRFRLDAGHAGFPGLDVLRSLSRHHGRQVMAPVVFTSAIGMGELFDSDVQRAFGTTTWTISQAPQVWLDHQVLEETDGLLLNWDAVEGLFPDGVLDAMFEAYGNLLDQLVADPAAWDAPVPSLLPAEQRARRERLNTTSGPQRVTRALDAFAEHARSAPDRMAVIDPAERVTYGELAGRARAVAGLLADAGVRRGDPVAITMPKSVSQVAAVLGIMWAGAVFVPVGVTHPLARRQRMYGIAGCTAILTDASTRETHDWPDHLAPLVVPRAGAAEPQQQVDVDADDLAYIIFTSGSTGEPKGVEMTHRAAMNTVEDIGDRAEITAEDRGMAVSALDHDWAVYDLFSFLSVGGSITIPADRRNADELLRCVTEEQVTVYTGVPALLDMLLIAGEQGGGIPSVRIALVGGDWVGLDLHERLLKQSPGARLVALGGATEVGIHSTWYEVHAVAPEMRSIPYGDPLRNQLLRVVDEAGRDRPDWVPGELWLGGVGVGPGYRGEAELTDRAFLTGDDGTAWYRTGDLARFMPDGTLEFLGRRDSQVKVLGHRIDLGEVEAVLRRHPSVDKAVALAMGDGGNRLAAVVVGAGACDAEQVRRFAAAHLPDYMVPNPVTVVPELPLSRNAKIDRRALTAILTNPVETGLEPPRGPREQAVAAVWADLLDQPAVGRQANFFALGGNSLLATRMVSRLRREGVQGANLGRLFTAPVLREFAEGLQIGDAPTGRQEITHDEANRHQPFPLTDVQRAYWLGRREEFTLGGVGSHWYWEFDGEDVDLDRLQHAWNTVVRRHDMLRAIVAEDGTQRVLPTCPDYAIEVVDGTEDADDAMAAQRQAMSTRVFDPTEWPMFELRAVRYGDRVRLGVSLDFVMLDALSIMVAFADLAALYEGREDDLPALEITFRDVVTTPDDEDLPAARAHWLERILTLPPAPQLPLAVDPAKVRRPRMNRHATRLEAERWERLRARAAAEDVTPSAVIAAVFAAVLRRWSAQGDLTLNLTLFDRPTSHPDIPNLVGDFTSLLLLACHDQPGASFAQSARRLQERLWSDLEHRAFGGIAVMRELATRAGVAEVAMPVVFTSTIGVGDATDRPFSLDMPFGHFIEGLSQTPQVWLDHQVTELPDGVLLNWDVVEELFPAGLVEHMFQAYQRALDALTRPEADWSAPLHVELPPEQRVVREQVNATDGPAPDRLLHQPVLAAAETWPDRPALRLDEQLVTHGQLRDWSAAIAALLVEAGVTPGQRVAIELPKGPAQVAATIAVLRAGGVYVPVGVDQPPLRRRTLLDRAGVRVVITDCDHAGADEPGDGDRRHVVVPPVPDGPVRFTDVEREPSEEAYLIYTSGSTGEPKGVVVSHAAARNTIVDINDRIAITETDRLLAVSALDFDLSVYDIFGVLGAGAALSLVSEDERRDPQRWLDVVRRDGVTLWNSVPALLDMLLLAAGEDGLGEAFRLAMVSGDWVGTDLRARLTDATSPACRLIAMGGATEAAIWSNAFEVTTVPSDRVSIPYGYPLRNQRFRVVGEDGRDQPDWVPGELWIGGAGVAMGYDGDPERTAERFVEHDGLRWYRTGDLGRYWPDGSLEFLGRADHQVKIRGHRIELGEIETALEQHPDITRAVAVVVGERTRMLAAAITCRDGSEHDTTSLTDHLIQRLPSYMMPQRVEQLAAMPLTANGKIDRSAVRDTLDLDAYAADEPPQGPTEQRLAGIWADLLDADSVSRSTSFFSLGGDSLLATRLVHEVRADLGVTLTLREVLTNHSVAALAALVDARLGERTDDLVEGVL